jgi:2,3-dihydroxybiphenyl 1,2-dioxygenase
MDGHHHRFEILPTGEDDIVFAGWEVKDAAAMRRVADQVRAFGVEVSDASPAELAERMVLGMVKFKDPSGMQTEIYHGGLLEHRPFISPRGFGQFKADNLGLGHIVLEVADPELTAKFYTEALGLKYSDFIQMSFGPVTRTINFLHANPRHHSLAFTGKPPPGIGSGKRMHHFMLEVHELDDVGTTFAIFQKRGIPAGSLGRHTNDRMFSFYGMTPSGFNIEFGWGAITIDDEDSWLVQNHRAVSIWGHGMPPGAGGPPAGGPPAGGPPAGGHGGPPPGGAGRPA